MRFDILTLFPGMFRVAARRTAFSPARAVAKGSSRVALHDIRAFATPIGRHQSVDDTPYGGGGGMVMSAPPLVAAIEAVQGARMTPARVIALGPQGRRFDQRVAVERSRMEPRRASSAGATRASTSACSKATWTMSSPSATTCSRAVSWRRWSIIDAVTRLLPGALGNELGAWEESLSDGCLEHPQYTRPRVFRGLRCAGRAALRRSRAHRPLAAPAEALRRTKRAAPRSVRGAGA
jgi:tRNA (guanine37-N1)-methyltransferase